MLNSDQSPAPTQSPSPSLWERPRRGLGAGTMRAASTSQLPEVVAATSTSRPQPHPQPLQHAASFDSLSQIAQRPLPPPPPNLQTSQQADQYACPICATPCYTLYQLNAHLDETHNEPEDEDIGDKIITWFKKTQRSAAKAIQNTTQKAQQTLSFERFDKVLGIGASSSSSAAHSLNGDGAAGIVNGGGGGGVGVGLGGSGVVTPSGPSVAVGDAGYPTRAASPANADTLLSEESVTRKHWQMSTPSTICTHPGCGKTLTPFALKVGAAQAGTGRQNCRRCGRLYCEAHTNLQMRLAIDDARHDINGVWCRVCQECYESREGYWDSVGVSRRKTGTFMKLRKARMDRVMLEETKLLRRLERLSASYAVENVKSKRSSLNSITGLQSSRRHIDISVVTWEEDAAVTRCPLCNKSFSSILSTISNRRHHCRLCGIVVCGNDTCSGNFPLIPQEPNGASPGDVRICKNCHSSITRRREREASLTTTPPPQLILMHQSIVKGKEQIEELLPRFNDLIIEMRGREIKMTDREYIIASRLRKTLLDHFADIERQGKQIANLPTQSGTTQKLQSSIQAATIQYLQHNMFTLHMMPQTTTEKAAAAAAAAVADTPVLSLADVERLHSAEVELSALEAQEEQLRITIDEAVRRRRLDDVASLKEALSEIVSQTDIMRGVVEGLRRPMTQSAGSKSVSFGRSASVAGHRSASGGNAGGASPAGGGHRTLTRSASVMSNRR